MGNLFFPQTHFLGHYHLLGKDVFAATLQFGQNQLRLPWRQGRIFMLLATAMEKGMIKEILLLYKNNTVALLTLISVCGSQALGQKAPVNLVPNGSFMGNNGCPSGIGDIDQCLEWWSSVGSPDYHHACGSSDVGIPENIFGYQQTEDSAYLGLLSYNPNYLGGQESTFSQLDGVLNPGVKYRVRLKASFADSVNYAVC